VIRPRFRLIEWIVVALVVAAAAGRELSCGVCLHDDAYISFRYARNMLRGEGLVYNPGERVEGYTNFLWVLLLASLGGPELDLTQPARIAGLAISLVLIVAVYVAARGLGLRFPWTLIPPVLLGLHGGFLTESVMGLETPLYALLCLLGGWLAVGPGPPVRRLWAGFFFALASMTRPDGLLVAALLLGWAVAMRRSKAWEAVGVLILLFSCYAAWRLVYYGYPFPNTFYAKVGWTSAQVLRGWRFQCDFLRETGAPWILAFLVSPFLGWRHRSWLLPAVSLVVAYSAYVVLIGGDFNLTYRFYMVLYPWMALLAAVSLGRLADMGRGSAHAIARVCACAWTVILILHLVGTFEEAWEYATERRNNLPSQRSMGAHLKSVTGAGDMLAIHAAGAVAYYADLPTVDMYGLTDVNIAHQEQPALGQWTAGHEKGDAAYVLSREPTILVLGTHFDSRGPVPWELFRKKRASRVDRDILSSEEFRRRYRRRNAPVEGGYFTYFVRQQDPR
jgi:arabinofuranosyltransferase